MLATNNQIFALDADFKYKLIYQCKNSIAQSVGQLTEHGLFVTDQSGSFMLLKSAQGYKHVAFDADVQDTATSVENLSLITDVVKTEDPLVVEARKRRIE